MSFPNTYERQDICTAVFSIANNQPGLTAREISERLEEGLIENGLSHDHDRFEAVNRTAILGHLRRLAEQGKVEHDAETLGDDLDTYTWTHDVSWQAAR